MKIAENHEPKLLSLIAIITCLCEVPTYADLRSSLSLVELREAIYCKMIISQRVLETFFSAAYDVVDAVCVDTTATLRECEKQVRLKSVL